MISLQISRLLCITDNEHANEYKTSRLYMNLDHKTFKTENRDEYNAFRYIASVENTSLYDKIVKQFI